MRFLRHPAIVGLLCLIGLVLAAKAFHVRYFIVDNGSMRPTIGIYDVVLTAGSDDLAVGDIITFNTTEYGVVTHRIHEVLPDGTYKTKGDFNDSPDIWKLKRQDVIGKKLVILPGIGQWAQGVFWSERVKQPRFIGAMLLLVVGAVCIFLMRRPDDDEQPKRYQPKHGVRPQKNNDEPAT